MLFYLLQLITANSIDLESWTEMDDLQSGLTFKYAVVVSSSVYIYIIHSQFSFQLNQFLYTNIILVILELKLSPAGPEQSIFCGRMESDMESFTAFGISPSGM